MMFITIGFFVYIYSNRYNHINTTINNINILDFKTIVIIFLISFMPAILITFRSPETGVDTSAYISRYMAGGEYHMYMIRETGEALFYFIYLLCYRYANLRVAFFIYAIISLWVALLAIFKLSKRINSFYVTVVFLLLFYQESFNLMRQIPAISIILYSFTFIYDKKPVSFFIAVTLAFLFHSSAIFCFPIYFLYKETKRGLQIYILWLIFLLFLALQFQGIFGFVNTIIGYKRFENYTDNIMISENYGWFKSLLLWIPLVLAMSLIQYSKRKTLQNREEILNLQFLWILVFIFLFLNFLRVYLVWLFRIGYYYQIGIILLAGRLSLKKKERNQTKRIFIFNLEGLILMTFYILYYFYLNYFVNFNTSALVNFQMAL